MASHYETVLERISKIYEKEGHSFKRASFTDNRVDFGIPAVKSLSEKSNIGKGYPGTLQSTSAEAYLRTAPNKSGGNQLQLRPSSTIQSAAYWPGNEYLLVSFKNGSIYKYEKVPEMTVAIWQQASSAGSWFYYNIRMSYVYEKM